MVTASLSWHFIDVEDWSGDLNTLIKGLSVKRGRPIHDDDDVSGKYADSKKLNGSLSKMKSTCFVFACAVVVGTNDSYRNCG